MPQCGEVLASIIYMRIAESPKQWRTFFFPSRYSFPHLLHELVLGVGGGNYSGLYEVPNTKLMILKSLKEQHNNIICH